MVLTIILEMLAISFHVFAFIFQGCNKIAIVIVVHLYFICNQSVLHMQCMKCTFREYNTKKLKEQ